MMFFHLQANARCLFFSCDFQITSLSLTRTVFSCSVLRFHGQALLHWKQIYDLLILHEKFNVSPL
jgi:hypothetical protein